MGQNHERCKATHAIPCSLRAAFSVCLLPPTIMPPLPLGAGGGCRGSGGGTAATQGAAGVRCWVLVWLADLHGCLFGWRIGCVPARPADLLGAFLAPCAVLC